MVAAMQPTRAALAAELLEQVVDGFHAVDHRVKVTDPPITADFTLSAGPNSIGADQYRAFLEKRPEAEYSTRHLVSNLRISDVALPDVHLTFTATVHRLDPGATTPSVTVADFTDVWTLDDGRWLQRSRSIRPAFPMNAG